MSSSVKGFIKLLAILLAPAVVVGGIAYLEYGGVWWPISGGIAGLLGGVWGVREVWLKIKLPTR